MKSINGLEPGLVSVVLVNYKGLDDTLEAISNLQLVAVGSHKTEVIVVDNASGDGSLERIRGVAPHVRLVQSKRNLGFAGGCNLGVEHARGEFIAFLNNDAKPDKFWITAALQRFEESDEIGAVASKVLDWDGNLVDFIGSGLTWFGMGYKPHTGFPVPRQANQAKDVLFGTGSAMFVRRSVFDELGGFDERYFMFFEDVDLGWRLNLLGYRFVYEPKSIAFHKHHASMKGIGNFKETFLLERNALFTLYKNLGEESLKEHLGGAILLSVRRSMARGNLARAEFEIWNPDASNSGDLAVEKDLLAGFVAVDEFITHLSALSASRNRIQDSRRVMDHQLWHLFGRTDAPSFEGDYFEKGYDAITKFFDVLGEPKRTRVLVITGDPLGKKMAGPAIRAWNIADYLSDISCVRLVSCESVDRHSIKFETFAVKPGDERSMSAHEKWADVIVFQGLAMQLFSAINNSKKLIVADIYDPMHLEQLEQAKSSDIEAWQRNISSATSVLNAQVSRADFFICASERQRNFYLGQLAALGRVDASNYSQDPTLRELIDVVPFGLPGSGPVHSKNVLKGVHEGIGTEDKLILWSGGLYNWFDPLTLIEAVGFLAKRRPNVRLFFMGTQHPHPGVPVMEIVARSQSLARDLGLHDVNVFFNDAWVDYDDRQNYLLEADAGVSTHFDHVETAFSFRTRILDYLWAGLPMVVTEGDSFAELISEKNLGIAVPEKDPVLLADAIEKVLFDEAFAKDCRKNIAEVRQDFEWRETLKPLLSFISSIGETRREPIGSVRTPPDVGQRTQSRSQSHELKVNIMRAIRALRLYGVSGVIKRLRRRIR